MAARKKQKKINLLPQEEFAASNFGRLLAWAMGSFRIIVIVTEMIVMGAFLSRFWLDARVSDLNDLIKQKEAAISASSDFEAEFRKTQDKLTVFTGISKSSTLAAQSIDTLASYLPGNSLLTSISLTEETIRVKGVSTNEQNIAQLIANLENSDKFENVSLTQLSTSENQPGLLVFTLSMKSKKGGV